MAAIKVHLFFEDANKFLIKKPNSERIGLFLSYYIEIK
jgi:hypothetical protein